VRPARANAPPPLHARSQRRVAYWCESRATSAGRPSIGQPALIARPNYPPATTG
jgi:hypothetical protein